MNKKILSTLMALLIMFSLSAKVSANPPGGLDVCENSTGLFWTSVVTVGTFLCVASGYAGYKLGLRHKSENKEDSRQPIPQIKPQDLNKIIMLVGHTSPDLAAAPTGRHRYELLAIDYINKLFADEIQKLRTSDENTLPAKCLSNLGSIYYGAVIMDLDTIAESGGPRRAKAIAIRLLDLYHSIQRTVDYDKRIPLGLLIDMLNEIKALLQEAAPLIEQKWYS